MLLRYTPSGTYYARFKAGGKAFRVSLKTKGFTVAKMRLNDKLISSTVCLFALMSLPLL